MSHKESLSVRSQKAELQKTLLASAMNKTPSSGKIVNAYGQEEVGVPRWQQKAAEKRQMYASNRSSADMSHEQRILQQMQERKRKRALSPESLRKEERREREACEMQRQEAIRASIEPYATYKPYSSSDSDSSSSDGGRRKKKDKKAKKERRKEKKKKQKHKKARRDKE